jgi:hypothetical protein
MAKSFLWPSRSYGRVVGLFEFRGMQMTKRYLAVALIAGLMLAPEAAFADANSWWGGEVHAVQKPGKGNGFGYGRYEVSAIAGTGVGSITGIFPLCYSEGNYKQCIDYNQEDRYHFEVDILETTPLGNKPEQRRWIETCTSDDKCDISHPNPAPRDGNGSLKAVSFNTFPRDNQVYAFADASIYTKVQKYVVTILPDKITWSVDGKAVLSRTVDARVDARRLNDRYRDFDEILREGKISLAINYWDGTQGNNGGFSGPAFTKVTAGTPAKIQRVAFYPANCTGDSCKIAKNPSFLADFKGGKFVQNGKTVQVNDGNICSENKDSGMFRVIYRNAFPVYVKPANVACTKKDGLTLKMTPK